MILSALALAATQASAATDPELEADLRCLAVTSLMVGTSPPEQQAMMAIGAMYFVGRIDARAPGHDIEGSLTRITEAMERGSGDVRTDFARCGKILETRGKALQAIGAALTRRGKSAK